LTPKTIPIIIISKNNISINIINIKILVDDIDEDFTDIPSIKKPKTKKQKAST